MSDKIKVADDIFMVPWYEGNGLIRREVWVDKQGKVAHYHLAYFNQEIFPGDAGRVMGYDYIDGTLKSHLMGTVEKSEFSTLEELEQRFDVKWTNLPKQCDPAISQGEPNLGGISVGESDAYPETKGMKLVIAKGNPADFFKRGRGIASKLDRGESVEPEKIILFGHRNDLCYSQVQK